MLLKDFAILNAFASVVDSIPGAEWLGLQAHRLPSSPPLLIGHAPSHHPY